MLNKLVCLFIGCVQLKSFGGYPQNMLEAAMKQGIVLWDIKSRESVCSFKVSASDYRELYRIAKRFGCRLSRINKCGIRYKINNIRHPSALFCGLALCIAEIILLGNIAFTIEVEGSSLTEHTLTEMLAQAGLSVGMPSRSINATLIERELVANVPEISSAAIDIEFGRVFVQLRESENKDSAPSSTALISDCDCQITDIYVKCGIPLVKTGDIVSRGQVLIVSDENMKRDSWTGYVQGSVRGYVHKSRSVCVSKYQVVRNLTGKTKKRYRLLIGGKAIGFSSGKSPYEYYERSVSTDYIRVFSVKLPILLETTTYFEVWQTGEYIDEAGAAEIFKSLSREYENSEFVGARIVSSQTEQTDMGDSYLFKTDYLLEKSIGVYFG